MTLWQIESPIGHLSVILLVVSSVYIVKKIPLVQNIFKYVPALIFVFFIPTSLTSLGILPQKSEFYIFSTSVMLPAILFIYLISTDSKLIIQLGPQSLFAVVMGSLSVVAAGIISYCLARGVLGDECWKQLTPLISGWIAGYVSMLSAKESIECSDANFAPVLVIASFLAYTWMTVLVWFSRYQTKFDQWVKAIELHDNHNKVVGTQIVKNTSSLNAGDLALWTTTGIVGSQFIMHIGSLLPSIPPLITQTTWGYLLLLGTGITLGFVGKVQKFYSNATPIGDLGLLVIVASFGARCSLYEVIKTPFLFLIAVVLLFIHFVIMLLFAKLFRIPAFVIATASQANIGGVISAPVVANSYKKGGESIGIIMGIFAAFIGLPLGLLAAQIMLWLK